MDPTYIRDHPTWGSGGIQKIYRFDNGRGILVSRRYSYDSGWTVHSIRFTGVEVTSFETVGDPLLSLNDSQVDDLARATQKIEYKAAEPATTDATTEGVTYTPPTTEEPHDAPAEANSGDSPGTS